MSTTGKKLDLKRELRPLYQGTAGKVAEVDVPPIQYLMIDGEGDPNTSAAYRESIEALFATAYGLKFAVKKSVGVDYAVMPLEGLWWPPNGQPFLLTNKASWLWTAMIAQPPQVTPGVLSSVLVEVQRKKKDLSALSRLRLAILAEGKSLQILHIGPYSAEGPTITRLDQYAKDHGYSPNGKHHEIYLNSPDRTPADKLKTIIRHPVRG